MNHIVLALILSCPTPKIVNKTHFAWNDNDQYMYNSALDQCARRYEKSVCLKKFTKLGERDYFVLCGAKE